MSNHEQNVNQGAGNLGSSRDPTDRLSNIQHGPRRGGIARKSADPVHPRLGVATKAARKTFAQPPSDFDSPEDDQSDRSMRPSSRADNRSVFASKTGHTVSAASRGTNSNQPTSKAFRKVTFTPDTQGHTSTSEFEGRSVPVRGLFGRSPSLPSQTRSSFVSKSTNQASTRRDPFFGGPPGRTTAPIRLAQPQIASLPRPAYGSGVSSPRSSAHSTHPHSYSSRFPSSLAGESISSASRPSFSKGTRHIPLLSKSQPLPPLEAVEDATWRKGFSTRKSFATHSGINLAPRMIAPSMSAPRRASIKTSVKDQLGPEDVNSTIFLGRNMTLYENNMAIDSDVEEISGDFVKRGEISGAKLTSRTLPTMQVGRKAGRQDQTSRVSSSSDSSEESPEESSEPSEDEEMSSDESESESDGEVAQRPASPSNNLVAALEALTLSSLRMQKTGQLPFLLRNMRRGFVHRCCLLDVPTKSSIHSDEPLQVQLLFRLQTNVLVFEGAEDYSDEYTTHMTSWNCPLCDLHGRFGTQAMLQKHIEWDHSEIKTKWLHNNRSMWTIILYIPTPHFVQELGRAPIQDDIIPPHSGLTPSPVASPVLSTIQPPLSMQESPVHSKLKRQPPSPPRSITRFTSQTSSRSRSRSATLTSSRPQTREPSYQPPMEDPLGPAAQYPYLPESSEDGELHFTCRPGGPRIYDLLNSLPLAPFGVLSWFIVDREEEMFELDDVLDEDKVMQALWGRWILLNHRKFIANYCQGTVAFIDEYWRMIHRAAGWAALRAWLLMFVVNRFLTGSEVARILKHYESLTNMDSWYTENES